MIEFYTWTTGNGRKVAIALEELGLSYRIHPVNLTRGEQKTPEFLAINPDGKIPAIIDPEGPNERRGIFESGHILLYLAEKTDQLLPLDRASRLQALQWLFYACATVTPQSGGIFRAKSMKEPNPSMIETFTGMLKQTYAVLDQRISVNRHFAGSEYSIADIALFPTVASWERQGLDLGAFPNLKRWHDYVAQRPAVAKGMTLPQV
jgi:GST-like protein